MNSFWKRYWRNTRFDIPESLAIFQDKRLPWGHLGDYAGNWTWPFPITGCCFIRLLVREGICTWNIERISRRGFLVNAQGGQWSSNCFIRNRSVVGIVKIWCVATEMCVQLPHRQIANDNRAKVVPRAFRVNIWWWDNGIAGKKVYLWWGFVVLK